MDQLAGVRALTFDCYGTLIDWDRGIRGAMAEIGALDGLDLEALVRRRELREREVEAGPYLPYGEVLERSLDLAARDSGREIDRAELARFAQSVATWPPFDETRACLERLASRFTLAIVSNVETEVLRASIALVGVPVEVAVTAEEVRSYKPRTAHFEEVLRRLELGPDAILHVAQSHYHDVAPARRLGWKTAWINRLGETAPPGEEPTLACANLQGLVGVLEL